MKMQDIRKKTIKELKDEILNQKKEMETVVLNVLKEKEKNVKKVMFLRRDIARLNTVLKEKSSKGENGK